jgi:hypothetical protein
VAKDETVRLSSILGFALIGAMTINIEYQDQHGNWHHYQTKHNQEDAYRVAQRRAGSTGKRHRLVDDGGRLLDLLNP